MACTARANAMRTAISSESIYLARVFILQLFKLDLVSKAAWDYAWTTYPPGR